MFRVIQKETVFLVSNNESSGKQKIEIKKYTFIIK